MEQNFRYPTDVLSEPDGSPWTCVRTMPRAEKRLAEWLKGGRRTFYLPSLVRFTTSHRRRRRVEAPLFPGYLFVAGEPSRADFLHAPGFLDVASASPTVGRRLPIELQAVKRALESGSPLELVDRLEPGEPVVVVSGALRGVEGRFQRWAKAGRLVLWIEMLGAGAAVEIDESCVERSR